MRSISVAVLDAAKEVAKKLGKKSQEREFTIYDYKEEEKILVCYEPKNYPEKIQGLIFSLNFADVVLLRVNEIDKYFGEMCVAIECSGKKGFVIADDIDNFRKTTNGLIVSGYDRVDEDIDLRKKILEKELDYQEAPAEILVDNYFMVKSTGLVILGKVKSGTINIHDKMFLLPEEKEAEIKSIQINDKNVDYCKNTRLGAVLKGIYYNDLQKGSILVKEKEAFIFNKTVELDVEVSKFSRHGIKENSIYYLSYGLQFVLAKAKGSLGSGKKGNVVFECEKKLAYRKGERVIIANPNDMPRTIGYGI